MKRKITFVALLLLTSYCFAQNHYSDFKKALQEDDTLKQREVLSIWEKENPKDKNLIISYFNYYYYLAITNQGLEITTEEPKNGEYYPFEDTTGKAIGYITNAQKIDTPMLQKAFDKINEGIDLYPNNLDMRFGKIYVLSKINDWKQYKDEIIKAIDYSSQNSNHWDYNEEDSVEANEEFFLSSIQTYENNLLNNIDMDNYSSEDSLLGLYIQDIGEEVLKYYPNNISSINDVAVIYFFNSNTDKALELLLKAESIDPKDCVVIGNIANIYKLTEYKEKAIEYYEKLEKYGDSDDVAFAKEQIKELKEK